MEYTSLEIRKIAVGTWIVIPNGVEAYLRGQNKYTGGISGDFATIKSINGAQEWKNIPYTVISYTDTITPANNRASFATAQAFLIYANQTGFFAEGGSGTGTATSFDELTDTPDSKTGSAGKAVVVSDDETQLEYTLIPIINNSTDIPDFPPALIEGKYIKVVGGVYTLVDAIEGTQNNIGKKVLLGFTDVVPTINSTVSRANEVGFVVSEQETPVLIYFKSFFSTSLGYYGAKNYNYIFLHGKGTYGTGNTTVTSSMLYPLPPTFVTPEDIEDDPNSETYNLDPVTDGDFITKANTTFWDFSESTYPDEGMNFYFSYTDDGVLYYALFVGTPGTYGIGGTPFTEDDFVTTTSNEVDPTIPIDPDNYLKLTGELFQDVEGEVNIQKLTVTQTPTDPQDVTTKTYVDGLTMGLLRLAGNWDASTGTYPTTGTGTGSTVRRGDSYIVTVAGTIYGQVFGIGDSFYSLVNNPAQTSSNWARFEVPTGQATDVMAGILLLFGTTGTSTIGTMTQKAITDLLALKADANNVLRNIGSQTKQSGYLEVPNGIYSNDVAAYKGGTNVLSGNDQSIGLQWSADNSIMGLLIASTGTNSAFRPFQVFGYNGSTFIKYAEFGNALSTITGDLKVTKAVKSVTEVSVWREGTIIDNANGQTISMTWNAADDIHGIVATSIGSNSNHLPVGIYGIDDVTVVKYAEFGDTQSYVKSPLTISNGIAVTDAINLGQLNAAISAATPTFKTINGNTLTGTGNVQVGDILQNGNSFGTTMLIGTNDSNAVNIKTNNVVRVNISDVGVVFNVPIVLSEILAVNSTFGRITMGVTSTPTTIKRTAGNISALKISYSVSAGTGDILQFESNSGSGDVIVGGVRKDGRVYGTNGTANNDFATILQLGKKGISTQSGTGSSSYNIPHGLGSIPTFFTAVSNSQDSGNISYQTADSTNITIFYSVAPPSGTNNLKWVWKAEL